MLNTWVLLYPVWDEVPLDLTVKSSGRKGQYIKRNIVIMHSSHFHLNVPIPNCWCPESILQKILVESGKMLYIYQKCMYADQKNSFCLTFKSFYAMKWHAQHEKITKKACLIFELPYCANILRLKCCICQEFLFSTMKY